MTRWTLPRGTPAVCVLILWAASVFNASKAGGQEASPAPAPSTVEEAPLSSRQEALALRYQRFETSLQQLAEFLRKSEPERTELLTRALYRSKENRVPDRMNELVELLQRGQLGDAIDGQEAVIAQLQQLLTLLQSEDRQSEIEKEKARIEALIRKVDKLIAVETDVRATTERGAPAKEAADQQDRVAKETQDVIDEIDRQDAERQQGAGETSPGGAETKPSGKPSESSPDGKSPDRPSDKPQDDGESPRKPGDQKPDGQPSDSQDKNAEGDPQSKPEDQPSKDGAQGSSQSGKPQPSTPKPGSQSPQSKSPQDQQGAPPQQGTPSEGSQPQDGQESPQQSPGGPSEESPQQKTPGREELEQAKREMERAIEELRRQQPDKASDRQDQALAELLQAKEKLEEILRQLREEEQELLLAALEARFRDMLGRQINVYNGTVGLAAVPEDQRTDRQRSRAIELARNQDEVALLAAKALTLLKEEGSSVAFPEAVIQIRDDMLTSARRLERVEVGELTQGIQKDIIESLEEILDSLQKELEKSRDRQQQSQQQQSQQQDPALVDALSELKMLRSLQYRVNRRTKQLGRLVEGEQAQDPDILNQLRELSLRQAKIQQTAYDLATGRNR